MTNVNYINYKAFTDTNLQTEPFEYMVVPNFIEPALQSAVINDFPKIVADGSFPLESLRSGANFLEFIKELKEDRFKRLVEEKFSVDLSNKPVMITARGRCKDSNGKIHIDSKGKIITVLVYLNEKWDSDGGKLRMLKNQYDLEDYVAEVAPEAGTLVIFKCTDNAWHGHKPYNGERKSIQLNWVIDESYLNKERVRHRISAWFKSVKKFLGEIL